MAQAHTIATLGSHSALQILKGAKDEGFPTLLITLKNRLDFYLQFPFIDECLGIDDYAQFSSLETQLLQKNSILIPHGSFVAYLGMEGNVNIPRIFIAGEPIDRPVIVKLFGAAGGEGYFVAHDQQEFDLKLTKFSGQKYIVQEYLVGVTMYPHFFYSPLTKSLELLSVDRRYETNADALGRISANIDPSFVVVGNIPLVIRESLLPEAFSMAKRIIAASQKLIDPQGLYGPFCLETIVTPDQKFHIMEISCRIVAGTNAFINGSPYSYLLYDQPMSTGRRIAREIKLAIKQNKLDLILN